MCGFQLECQLVKQKTDSEFKLDQLELTDSTASASGNLTRNISKTMPLVLSANSASAEVRLAAAVSSCCTSTKLRSGLHYH
jgi:hypothetical protein